MSLRKAINAMCKECIYDPHEPGKWRMQVEACTISQCPLHPVRPQSFKKPLNVTEKGEFPTSTAGMVDRATGELKEFNEQEYARHLIETGLIDEL